ncbi:MULTISPECIES: helix-turn-helix transcriptional regulator [Vibrio]|uniref:AraC family transcriptional regulator n=1 Tax=Vibrio rhizosphaerae TaxID=398736 RepID=A0ABU4IXH2_9VIBR|nr:MULTISPECIES: AraC family transcriptional regulator [Vibrio]MDW6093411.1 AraC family transcriptional regulator [Vibrio rhizosphaerae]
MNHKINYYCYENMEHFRDNLINELYQIQPSLGLSKSRRKLDLLVKTLDYVIENISMEISLDDISEEVDASKYEICRLFNEVYKTSPMRWIWDIRIALAKEYIEIAPDWSLTDISNACGYSSLAHFSRSFSKAHQITPLKYKHSITTKEKENKPFEIIYGNHRSSFSRGVLLDKMR